MLLVFVLTIPLFSFADAEQEKVSGRWMNGSFGKKYRYVSTYTTKTITRPVKGFPWFQEECHDDGDTDWSQWNQMISYEVAYNGSIGFELLGFSLEFGRDVGRSHTIGFNRWISATAGIKARHVLAEEYEVLEGVTRKEVMDRNGTIRDLGWESPFKISHLNYGLLVQRSILEVCDQESLTEFYLK